MWLLGVGVVSEDGDVLEDGPKALHATFSFMRLDLG